MSAVALKASKSPRAQSKVKPLADRVRLSLDEKVRFFEHLSGVKVRVVQGLRLRFVATLPMMNGHERDWVVYDEKYPNGDLGRVQVAAACIRSHLKRMKTFKGLDYSARRCLADLNTHLLTLYRGYGPSPLPACGLPRAKEKALSKAVDKVFDLHGDIRIAIAPHLDMMTVYCLNFSVDDSAPCLELSSHFPSDIMRNGPDSETEEEVKALEAAAG